ncbi:hypothetical protein MX850_02620 [Erysipelothrix sp. Poltava]|nr:hypothetical protein MX850_02620 [Erysipelothrix sp. Poltava]
MIKDIDARLDAILEYYPKTSVVREAYDVFVDEWWKTIEATSFTGDA